MRKIECVVFNCNGTTLIAKNALCFYCISIRFLVNFINSSGSIYKNINLKYIIFARKIVLTVLGIY